MVSVLKTFSQLGGSDEVWYNPGDNKYYLAMSSWTSSGKTGTGNPTPSLGIIDAGSRDSGPGAPEWIQNILTTGPPMWWRLALVSPVTATTEIVATTNMEQV